MKKITKLFEDMPAAFALAVLASGAAAEPAPGPQDPLTGKKVELRGVEEGLRNLTEEKRKLDQGLERIETERSRLAQVLIEAAAKLRDTEKQTAEIESELQKIDGREETLRASLHARRALIGEVLLVLQRMNRRPPPAVLAEPEDILKALRAAMTMGAVLPQMRGETLKLQNDLSELVQLREAAHNQRAALAHRRDELTLQRANLEQMIEDRRAASRQITSERAAQEERARKLAEQATSIKELIARMEKESEAARLGAQAAREAEARREAADAQASREQRAKALAQPFRDPARLAPAVGFADLKGKLQLPAVGYFVRRFGAQDGYGGVERGDSLQVRENGLVSAPCDGWVAYAGPYRSYGGLLIINAGGGYYVVLAGVARMNVGVGQFVLAGEPVASMGDGSVKTAATVAIGAKQPILYVEIRKDGNSIDPSSWWARSDTRKVGG
ncbi:murein hydrolase activator EnvC family protein [Methylocystis bryophila]|nr:peptidoglycan DD-metalloendopeptidase family protein [Methylocystis bryophila]BDV40162.1 membrane protein [Methylocystis bryophila]